jgi:PAS domain S-box-containing protein
VKKNETTVMAIDSDSERFSRALWSAILWPVCVILLTALLLLAMLFMLMKIVKWSEHSYEVIAQTRSCESLITSTQSGIRGYLLSGDHSYQNTFPAQHAKVDQAFLDLKKLVRADPRQSTSVDALIQLKDSWFAYAKTIVDQHPSGGLGPNGAWIRMGDVLMSNLRAQFQSFTQAQENLHDQRLSNVTWAKRALGFAGVGLGLIMALTVGQLVRRQFMALAIDYRSALHTIEQRHAALLRSEADLEEQKEWFRVTLTSIGDGVIVTDKEGRIVFLNHEAERLTGWSSVEALLKPLSSVFRTIHEETRAKLEDPVAQVFRDQKVVSRTDHSLLVSRQGDEWPINESAAPIHAAKEGILGVVLVFHNATEMRRVQNALKIHSEDLEKRVDERTTTLQQTVSELESFSYTISHDLRSPLRAMQGFAQALLEDYGDKIDDQGKNYLDRIKNAAERLDHLIQDLLSYTRISRQDAPLVPLDVDKVLRDIVQNYPNLHSPATEVEIVGTLPRILGQEASLTQVLSNLLGNAAKFVPQGTVPHIRVWSEDLGNHVRLWIEDNGIGIAPGDYDRIFQMFVQVNDSHLYGGTGVGLAIVKKAVESMQGVVGLAPAEGGGTTFWVELIKAP